MKTLMVRLGLWLAYRGGWHSPICQRPHHSPVCQRLHYSPICQRLHHSPICELPHHSPVCKRPHLPIISSPLSEQARALCVQEEALGGGGESKRHRVYARLLKEFPGQTREIALAIEHSLPESP